MNELREGAVDSSESSILEDVERDHILRVFRETGGVVSTTASRFGYP